MTAYIVRRLFSGIIMLIVMSLVTFLLFFASPVDPAGSRLRQELLAGAAGADPQGARLRPARHRPVGRLRSRASSTAATTPTTRSCAKTAPEQVAHCPAPCLGYSKLQNATVTSPDQGRLPGLGVPGPGRLRHVDRRRDHLRRDRRPRKGTIIDRGIVGISLIFFAFPTFFIGLFLYKFVAIKWQIVPIPEYVSIADGGVGLWLSGLLLPA